MARKTRIQEGITVRESGSGIIIENEYRLGSANRILELDSVASQKLLDFLAGVNEEEEIAPDTQRGLTPDAPVTWHDGALWKCANCGHEQKSTDWNKCGRCGEAAPSKPPRAGNP